MSIQNGLQGLKLTSVGPFPRFLIMFIGVVAGPLVLLVIGGYNPNILGQASSAWSFLALALLLLICIGGGFLLFRRKSDAIERSLYQPAVPLKGAEMNAKTDHHEPT
jgi:hypothetical protein